MAPVLFLAGFGLLALPGAARRLGRRLAPAEWSRLCVAALVGGALAIELSVLLYAAPTVLRFIGVAGLADICERALGAFLPGGARLGWPAAVIAVAFPALTAVGAIRAHRRQRAVHVEACLGEHGSFCGHALVLLPTDSAVAFCSRGPTPQIVVSQGLVESLGRDELEAVLRHEAAHLEHGHQRILIMTSALEHSLGVLPFVRRSTAALRTALERWADETAAGSCAGARAVVRRALLSVTATMLARAVPAFSAADNLAERLVALGEAPPEPTLARRVVAYAPAVFISAAVVVAISASAGDAGHLLAWTHHCPT